MEPQHPQTDSRKQIEHLTQYQQSVTPPENFAEQTNQKSIPRQQAHKEQTFTIHQDFIQKHQYPQTIQDKEADSNEVQNEQNQKDLKEKVEQSALHLPQSKKQGINLLDGHQLNQMSIVSLENKQQILVILQKDKQIKHLQQIEVKQIREKVTEQINETVQKNIQQRQTENQLFPKESQVIKVTQNEQKQNQKIIINKIDQQKQNQKQINELKHINITDDLNQSKGQITTEKNQSKYYLKQVSEEESKSNRYNSQYPIIQEKKELQKENVLGNSVQKIQQDLFDYSDIIINNKYEQIKQNQVINEASLNTQTAQKKKIEERNDQKQPQKQLNQLKISQQNVQQIKIHSEEDQLLQQQSQKTEKKSFTQEIQEKGSQTVTKENIVNNGESTSIKDEAQGKEGRIEEQIKEKTKYFKESQIAQIHEKKLQLDQGDRPSHDKEGQNNFLERQPKQISANHEQETKQEQKEKDVIQEQEQKKVIEFQLQKHELEKKNDNLDYNHSQIYKHSEQQHKVVFQESSLKQQVKKLKEINEKEDQKQGYQKGYRFDSQMFQSIEETGKEKEIIEFVEFLSIEQSKTQKLTPGYEIISSLNIDSYPQISSNPKIDSKGQFIEQAFMTSPRKKQMSQTKPIVSQNKNSHLQKQEQKSLKKIQIEKQKLNHQKQSILVIENNPNQSMTSQKDIIKEGVGKISKKGIVQQKRVHEIMRDLQKHDEQKAIIPQFSQRKTLNRRPDLAKLDYNIVLESNVMSITVGEIISKQSADAKRILEQIQELKRKLASLEKKKSQEQAQIERVIYKEQKQKQTGEKIAKESQPKLQEQQESIIAKQESVEAKSGKKPLVGRIYKKIDLGNSRVSQYSQTPPQKAPIKQNINITATITDPKNRFSSTDGFRPRRESQDSFINGGSAFRVKRQGKSSKGEAPRDWDSHFEEKTLLNGQKYGVERNLDKSAGFIREASRLGDNKGNQLFDKIQMKVVDPFFQTQNEKYGKLQFGNYQRLVGGIQPVKDRELNLGNNHRQEVQRFFCELGPGPVKDSDQSKLTQLARSHFKKFGVELKAQKKVLSVRKYKNCVWFALDSERTMVWYYEGRFYFGGWKTNGIGEGEKQGWGYEYVPGKYVYSGNFKANKRDGYGLIKFLSRDIDVIYEGGWSEGKKEGFGLQVEPDGVEYLGGWLEGKKNGLGQVLISQNEHFKGNFKRGLKNGQGVQNFTNGDIYQGDYLNGKFHGRGIYIWANKSKYEGDFKQGAREGQGIWVADLSDPISDRYEGQYLEDKKNGFGIYRWRDGTVYEGQFMNDLKHGEGVVTYADGRSVKFEWKEGNAIGRPQQISKKSDGKKHRRQTQKSQGGKSGSSNAKYRLGEARSRQSKVSQKLEQL